MMACAWRGKCLSKAQEGRLRGRVVMLVLRITFGELLTLTPGELVGEASPKGKQYMCGERRVRTTLCASLAGSIDAELEIASRGRAIDSESTKVSEPVENCIPHLSKSVALSEGRGAPSFSRAKLTMQKVEFESSTFEAGQQQTQSRHSRGFRKMHATTKWYFHSTL